MGKKYVSCPFCWEKIKETAVKCMHCKKWITNNENLEASENIKSWIEKKENEFNVWAINSEEDKKLLWWLLGFQFVCLFWAFFPYIYDLLSK